jgi:hypothetical protein
MQIISDDTLAGFKKRNASEGEGSVSDGGPDSRPHYLRPTSAGAGRVASPVNGRSNRCGRWHALGHSVATVHLDCSRWRVQQLICVYAFCFTISCLST